MKKILLILLLITAVNGNAYDQPDKPFFQQDDKVLHMGFSVVTGMAGNAFAYQQLGWTKDEAWWAGLATALVIGAAKELYDTNFDWEDMGADALGGVVGTTGMWTIYKFQSGK